jgi:predicted amidohydrolase
MNHPGTATGTRNYTGKDNLRLALWQCPFATSTAEALARLDTQAAQATAQGVDLLVCPEMSLTGYLLGADRVQALAEPANGPLSQAVGAIAQRHSVAIVYGYPERHSQGDRPFNAVQAIGPQGQTLGQGRKTHLYGAADAQQFSPGPQASQVFEWRGWRIGLLVCFDVEFPETVRLLALQGADLVLVPTANMVGFDEVPRLLVPARACENRLFVAYANACGAEADTVYGGLSTVCGPTGRGLARAGQLADWRVQDLPRSALAAARTSDQRPHRRPDLYGPLAALVGPAGTGWAKGSGLTSGG